MAGRDFSLIETPDELCDALHEAKIVGVAHFADSIQILAETPLGEEFAVWIEATIEMQGRGGKYLMEPCLGIRVVAESQDTEEDG
jgi:hypothetical protein